MICMRALQKIYYTMGTRSVYIDCWMAFCIAMENTLNILLICAFLMQQFLISVNVGIFRTSEVACLGVII